MDKNKIKMHVLKAKQIHNTLWVCE